MKTNCKKYITHILFSIFLSVAALILNISIAGAAPPVPGQIYYGTVTVISSPAGSGATVTAKVNGAQVGSATTDTSSKYYMMIPGNAGATVNSGATITFYVNSVQASPTATYGSGSLNINITAATAGSAPSTISAVSSTLAGATVGSMYSASVLASGGTSPYTWTLTSGSLPAGLSLSSSGIISGTPTTSTASSFTLQVTDSASQSSSATYSITVGQGSTTTTSTTTPTTTTTTTTTTTAATTPTTTTQATTVSTSVLGTAGSFSLSSGSVSNAASISSSDGRISLNIAANTSVNLQGSRQLTVTQLTSPPAPPAGAKMVAAYAFGPDNTTFSPALTVTIKYNPSEIPAGVTESDLYIAALEGSNWNALQSTVNTQAKTVTAQLSHFSSYALLGRIDSVQTPTTIAFAASDLTLSPEVATVGEQVTLSLRLINNGTSEDSKPIVVKVNDKNEAQQIVTLAPNKSQFVSFNLSLDAPGTYRINVEGLSASLEVKGPASTVKSQQPADFSLLIVSLVFGAGLLLVVVLIVLIVRRRT